MTFPSLPRKKPSYYVYWIETKSGIYIGSYGKREYAKKVLRKGDRIVRRKRGTDPNIPSRDAKRRNEI